MDLFKKFTKVTVCSVLAGTCIFGANTNVSAKETSKYDNVAKWATKCSGIIENDEIRNECNGYKEYLEKNKDSKIKLTPLKKDLSNLKDVTFEYQEKLMDVTSEVNSVDASIDKMNSNVKELNENIESTKKEIEKRKKVVLDRMVSMQATVNTNQFANYVMGAEDLVDMIQRSKAVEQLTADDREQITLLNNELSKLKTQKAEISRMQETLKIQKEVLDSKKKQLKEIDKANTKLIKEHKEEIKKIYKEEAKKAEKESNSLTSIATASKINSDINEENKKAEVREQIAQNILVEEQKENKVETTKKNTSSKKETSKVTNTVSKPHKENNNVSKPSASKPSNPKPSVNVPSNGSKGARIAAAAKAQLGVHQDCTMLVTNSLKAVGINFHGWPAEYLSLGTITSNPQPGDICVYGNAHVAIYIGGGKAVHGGWSGNNTAIASVVCSTGTPVYVRVK